MSVNLSKLRLVLITLEFKAGVCSGRTPEERDGYLEALRDIATALDGDLNDHMDDRLRDIFAQLPDELIFAGITAPEL